MHTITKSEKADDAPLSGHNSIREYRGNIDAEKDKAKNKRDNYLYNYKMNILEKGCHSRAISFESGIASISQSFSKRSCWHESARFPP
jgi:hypothetical protein